MKRIEIAVALLAAEITAGSKTDRLLAMPDLLGLKNEEDDAGLHDEAQLGVAMEMADNALAFADIILKRAKKRKK